MPSQVATAGDRERRFMRLITSKLSRLARMDRRRTMLLAEAILWLAVMRAATPFVPFRRYRTRLGAFVAPVDGGSIDEGRQAASAARAALAAEIGWAVACAARNAPFAAVCLPQALAAKIMLRRRGIVAELFFGFSREGGGELATHAWLRVGDVEVTGYPVARSCTPIACYR
jgi:hypothetical protein